MHWMSTLTMEEVFLVTGLAVLIIGGAIGAALVLFNNPQITEDDEEELDEKEK